MYPAFGNLTWITPYGLMLVTALFACWFYARRRAVTFNIDVSHVDLAVPLVFALSLLGAQVFTFIRGDEVEIAGDVLSTHTRYRLFGLLLIGLPALYAFSRLSGLSFRKLLDLFALPVILWLALLRFGCFMAGCCWGDLTHDVSDQVGLVDPRLMSQILTLPWFTGDWLITAISFPADSLAYQQHLAAGLIEPGVISSLPIHPTQLYELVGLIILLVILRPVENRWTLSATTALVALGGYAVLRFFIEFLRADNALVSANLTLTQLICLTLIFGCVIGIAMLKPTKAAWLC